MNKKISLLALLLIYHLSAISQMTGTYTIDVSGTGANNFNSFEAAVRSLETNGVSGHVIFNVKEGIYQESVLVPSIPGAGIAATITFRGEDNNPDLCFLEPVDPPTEGSGVLNFSGAQYVSFKNIGFKNYLTGILFSNTAAVQIKDNSEHLVFDNCRFIVDTTSTSPLGASYIYKFPVLIANNTSFTGAPSRMTGQHITFKHCVFKGGAIGLATTGRSYDIPADSINVDSSEFTLQTAILAEARYCSNISITNSRLHNMRTDAATVFNGNGLRLYWCRDYNVSGNIIISRRIPLSILQEAATGTAVFGDSYVTNNYLLSDDSYVGLFTHARNTSIYHNTFKSYAELCSGVRFDETATDIDFTNNLVQSGYSEYTYSFYAPSTYTGTIDNNVYYGSTGLFYFGAVYNGFNSWKAAYPAFNTGSVYDSAALQPQKPDYAGIQGYHTGSASTGVTADIYGHQRCLPPAIGAFEYIPQYKAALSNPSTILLATTVYEETDTAWIYIKNNHKTISIDAPGSTITDTTYFTLVDPPAQAIAANDSVKIGVVFGPVKQCISGQFESKLVIARTGCPYIINDTILITADYNKAPVTAALLSNDTTICQGDTIILAGTGSSGSGSGNGTGNMSYTWYPFTTLSSGEDSAVRAFPETNTTYYFVASDESNCSDTTSLTVNVIDCTTSIPGINNTLPSISLYPNPASDILNILNAPMPSNIAIFDITGKKQLEVTNTNILNIRSLSPGIYMLKLSIGPNATAEPGIVTGNCYMRFLKE